MSEQESRCWRNERISRAIPATISREANIRSYLKTGKITLHQWVGADGLGGFIYRRKKGPAPQWWVEENRAAIEATKEI